MFVPSKVELPATSSDVRPRSAGLRACFFPTMRVDILLGHIFLDKQWCLLQGIGPVSLWDIRSHPAGTFRLPWGFLRVGPGT